MTTYEIFIASMKRHSHYENEQNIAMNVAIDLGCDEDTADSLMLAYRMKWYKPEMTEEIIANPYAVHQMFSKEVKWDTSTKKFVPKVVAAT